MGLYWKLRHLVKGHDPLQNHAPFVILPLLRREFLSPLTFGPFLIISTLILFVFYPSLGSHEFPQYLGGQAGHQGWVST